MKKSDMPLWKYPPQYELDSRRTLEMALGSVAAYQSWRARDPGADSPIDRRYAAMPALTKADIRRFFPDGFTPPDRRVAEGIAAGDISFVQSSGTTDDKVTNIWNQKWWDASEQSSWKLNSNAVRYAGKDRPEAILVNPLNVGIPSETELPMEKRRLARFLYLNEKIDTLAWTPAHMDRMIRELEIFRPNVLEASPSMLAKLCRYIAASGKAVYQPKLINFTYEYPAQFHYRQIRRVFNSPLASSYGTTETGYVFMQCEAGKYHQNLDFCRVDFQPLKKEQGGPYLGRILVTTFNNPWYVIVRFDTGDLVRIEPEGKCRCGRDAGMILATPEGRAVNLTRTTGGRLVTLRELDEALGKLDYLEEYKLEQTDPESYCLYLVVAPELKVRVRREAEEILKELYGENAVINVKFEEAIAPSISGKYLLAKSLVPVQLEEYLEKA